MNEHLAVNISNVSVKSLAGNHLVMGDIMVKMATEKLTEFIVKDLI